MNYKLILSLVLVAVLSACSAVDDMKGIFEKQTLAQEYIKKRYGWESQLGFNITNGVLAQVTVVLNADDVKEKKVEELESIVHEVVSEVFSSQPKAVFIQIISGTEHIRKKKSH